MARGMTPQQLVEWTGYLDGGHADDWRQAAMIASTIENGFRRVLNSFGADLPMLADEDFLPRFKSVADADKQAKAEAKPVNLDQVRAALIALGGAPPNG